MMDVEVFFDYTCGYSNRARHWLDALEGLEVAWRPFSLLEQHRGGDGPPVFERAENADNVSLIALGVHEAVRAVAGDLDGFRGQMFTAWHEAPGRLSSEDILGFGRVAGLSSFDHQGSFAALAAEHAKAKQLGVFGTPTLVLGNGQLAFVKLDAVPSANRARVLWDSVLQLAEGAPELREWQRVTPPTKED